MYTRILLGVLVAIFQGTVESRLTINGTQFYLNGTSVFLNGANQAWVNYGWDFGNNNYETVTKDDYELVLKELSEAGGNSLRIWLHIEGQMTPHFTDEGLVDGTDEAGTMISDLQTYLRTAADMDVLIFITLWNGAYKSEYHDNLAGLILNTTKLQSYIDNALTPMVTALKDEPGLGGWDIINEPAGEMIPGVVSDNPCADTSALVNSGMGWAGELYTAENIQRFVNLQTAAIHKADPEALVSVGVWNPIPNTDAFGLHDLYKDECLIAAGGEPEGTLDFYQYHSYAWQGKFDGRSPFEHVYEDFLVEGNKPIVIGEFRESDGAGLTIEEMYSKAYNDGYAGAWAWSWTDGPWENILRGVASLSGKNITFNSSSTDDDNTATITTTPDYNDNNTTNERRIAENRLTIRGSHFYLNGTRVFLNGANQAWMNYGWDFGNNNYETVTKDDYELVLKELSEAGGNSLRFWLHIEGQMTPHFTDEGLVDGTDEADTMISDLQTYLRTAADMDVLIFITLWNGAYKSEYHDNLAGLILNTTKLQSYIDNALTPMVTALKDEPGLGGWDIINEPAGEMIPGVVSDNPCADTSALVNSGMGWAGELYTAEDIQRFVNLQTAAIHKADPEALVSVGVWNPIPNTDAFGLHDLYKDECLIAAGGEPEGTLDFYQYHSYAWEGKFDGRSPFEHVYEDFLVEGNKPIVIGEFRESDGAGLTIEEMYSKAYNDGYAGAWAWSWTDGPWENVLKGVASLANKTDETKGLVPFIID